jgi:hypothetical protein
LFVGVIRSNASAIGSSIERSTTAESAVTVVTGVGRLYVLEPERAYGFVEAAPRLELGCGAGLVATGGTADTL